MEAKRKTRLGRVLSNKMDKTVLVLVEYRRPHPQYKKVVRYKTKVKAHDEGNVCNVGDMIMIAETRPLSKDKRWRVTEIVTKAETIEVKPEEIKVGDDTAIN